MFTEVYRAKTVLERCYGHFCLNSAFIISIKHFNKWFKTHYNVALSKDKCCIYHVLINHAVGSCKWRLSLKIMNEN